MRLALFLLGFSVLTACGGSDDKPQTAPIAVLPPMVNHYVSCDSFSVLPDAMLPRRLSAPSDWVVLGSSTAAGAGASKPQLSWVELLRADTVAKDAQLHNIARGGYSSYQALSSRCTVDPLRKQPDPNHNIDRALTLAADMVLLNFSSNDAALGYTAVETAANILLLRQQLADKNVALLVLSAQPRNMAPDKQQQLLELNRLLQPVLQGCYVDVYAALTAPGGGLAPTYDFGDGVHLNDAGHQLVFTAVKAALQSGQCVQLP
jgi:acyl-CoA thioesterase I